MQCPACEFEAAQADFGEPLKCPGCGAFYAKALARKQQQTAPQQALPLPVKPASVAPKVWQKPLAIVAAVLFAVFIAAGPYITVFQIKQAAKARDAEAMAEYVDFLSVRASLKDQLNAFVMKRAAESENLKNNPFAALGMALAGTFVEKMVDSYVTPDGLTALMAGDKPEKPGSRPPTTDRPESSGGSEKEPFANASYGYEGFSKFVVEVTDKQGEAVRFILRREGLFGWRLSDIRVPLGS
ncbi:MULTISPECIES: DUF2939 domain-containing protein [unclassified Pseudomonas]|uniref:DUF2939 domain-containing protein n=1 Tax=unclassified Pseudomonas TaxID=196821 RepID=UPI00244AAD66|nr:MULTISPECIES: DUF2939 domain-containing protein [unclassified Pseudomonas]MDG9925433.1 DUF2939 domain-containing protein [Pseudomonas sp. GD04045]MDH0034126.1 DUF2939 domain-containing protein [Pseudomonas sp. GD04019]